MTIPLKELVIGHNGGIFNGPQFKRSYVDSLSYGVPFLTINHMLRADLSQCPLLRKSDANSAKLSFLELKEGATLISCSGSNAGRLAYARAEMNGYWACQDILKVVPDQNLITSGYLYAFLSSKFGIPLIASGVYGAAIRHIEPEHISDLPVPRLNKRIEDRIHNLIDSAASKRTEAAKLTARGIHAVYERLNIKQPSPLDEYERPFSFAISALTLGNRLEPYYFCRPNQDAKASFRDFGETRNLSTVADIFIPGIFKRRYADDPNFGVPYVTGADVFNTTPSSDRYLMTSVVERHRLRLTKGMIVIQEAGQLSGIIGRSVLVGAHLDGYACSNNMIRVLPHCIDDTGFIFAVLSSEYGVRLLKREAAGSSIPHLEGRRVGAIEIPWPKAAIRREIGDYIVTATRLRDEANSEDEQARKAVEDVIEENA